MVYKYRATQYKVPAQVAGEYLEELGKEEGGLTARTLLERSRPEEALLHECFEWDDTEAAERYRLGQARYFISNVVTVELKGKPVEPTRAFVQVTQREHNEVGIFKPVHIALSDSVSREIVLGNAMRDMQSFKDKYATLEELASVIEAMDEVLKDA